MRSQLLLGGRSRSAGTNGSKVVMSGLTKRFGDVLAVDDLSFSVEPGSIVGFLGPNGAGKTTTLRMLLGLVRPDSGTATIGSRRYADLPAPNDEVGAVIDSGGFHGRRSSRDHLRIYCSINGYPLARADEVLDQVGLAAAGTRRVETYSLGMRQRLAMATALLGNPGVLVLDEPANGLDPEGIVWMRELLRSFADEGRTVLVSSHVLHEVQQLVDRVVIINKGRLVREGTVEEIVGWSGASVSVRSPQSAQLAAVLTAASSEMAARGAPVAVRVKQAGSDTLLVEGLTAAEIGQRAFVARVEIHELCPARGDLEQVFFTLTTN